VQEYTTTKYLIKFVSIQVDYWKLECHLVPLKMDNYFWYKLGTYKKKVVTSLVWCVTCVSG